jgi:hypothetical protein
MHKPAAAVCGLDMLRFGLFGPERPARWLCSPGSESKGIADF